MASRVARRPRKVTRPDGSEKISPERIWATALALIDAKGLDQFSLRDVARSMGVYPRTINYHVGSRNDLLSEVVSYALRDVYAPALSADWREWLRSLFTLYRRALRRHPNIAPLVGASLISGRAIAAETVERILTVLTNAGFEGDLLVEAYNVVVAAQVGFVTLELGKLPADDAAQWVKEQKKRIAAIDAARYPTLGRFLPTLTNRAFILRWSNGVEVPLDSSFECFVDVVIQGLERLSGD